MKNYILSLFICFVIPVTSYAYDFEAKDIVGNTFYFNILSDKDADVKTCEITYSDEENIGGNIVYNQKNEYYTGYHDLPSYVKYQGDLYLVSGIGAHAFQDTNITSISLGYSNASIGSEAFKNCSLLRQVTLPCEKSLEISNAAFENCKSLESVGIYSYSVPYITIKISSKAFHECPQMKEFLICDSKPENFEIAKDAFDYHNEKINCTLNIGEVDKECFKDVEPWCYFSEIVEKRIVFPTSVAPINEPIHHNPNRTTFDLKGNSVDPSNYKGIYIINGKKVIRRSR